MAGGLAQEIGLFPIAFNQMDSRPGTSASAQAMHQAGKSGPGAEIDPDFGLRGEVEKLQRIGDVPGPDCAELWTARSG